jgi:RNA polymerase sigma factor (sigma-70 family)
MRHDDLPIRAPFNDGQTPDDVAKLVKRATGGDQTAWDEIVERFGGRVWSICRAYRLAPSDAADVFQQTWLRVLEHLDAVRDPERLGAWIATTCRHEALAMLRRTKRLQLIDDEHMLDWVVDPSDGPDQPVLIAERDAELWRTFRRLSLRCQAILRILVVEIEGGRPSYELVAAALGMPVGSLGPSRGRCLVQLRRLLEERVDGTAGAL